MDWRWGVAGIGDAGILDLLSRVVNGGGGFGWVGGTELVKTAEHPAVEKCMKIEAMQPFDRVTWNPNQMNGQPCVRGMRLTVRRVVEAVALYPNRDDLFRNYPELEPEDLRQALAFAAANLEDTARETTAA